MYGEVLKRSYSKKNVLRSLTSLSGHNRSNNIYKEAKKLEISNFSASTCWLRMPRIMKGRAAVCQKREERAWQFNPTTACRGYNIHGKAGNLHSISFFEFAASAVCCRWDLYEIKPSIFNEGELSRCREQMSRRGIWMFAGQNKSQASQKCVTQRPFSFFVKLGCLKKICRVTSSDMAVAS